MINPHITRPLSREILSMYHSSMLSDEENAAVLSLLTDADREFLATLDKLDSGLRSYADVEITPPSDLFERTMDAVQSPSPQHGQPSTSPQSSLYKAEVLSFPQTLLHKISQPKILFSTLAASILGFVAVTQYLIMSRSPHDNQIADSQHSSPSSSAASPGSPHSIPSAPTRSAVPPIDPDIFPDRSHITDSLTAQQRQQALACINNLFHADYNDKSIINVVHAQHSRNDISIFFSLPEPGKALKVTVSRMCLTHPTRTYTHHDTVFQY